MFQNDESEQEHIYIHPRLQDLDNIYHMMALNLMMKSFPFFEKMMAEKRQELADGEQHERQEP